MLKGKTVVLAVSGSIAAYKIASLASALKKLHANVQVLMTKNAINFINPITFESLTGNKCLVDTFDRNFQYSVEHVALAKQADVVLVAPCHAGQTAWKIYFAGSPNAGVHTSLPGSQCPMASQAAVSSCSPAA